MNIDMYFEQRRQRTMQNPAHRTSCWRCFQPASNCYCEELRPFDSKIEFVILIHPIESRRRIATGRMSHLTLRNSHLIEGEDFSDDQTLNAILEDSSREIVMLYPGPQAVDLKEFSSTQLNQSSQKKLTVIVIDGTWATARKMVRSRSLQGVPRVSFRPSRASRFRVRKQPNVHCFSTIEAIFETIEILGPSRGFDVSTRRHQALIDVFERMVERQITFLPEARRADFL